MISKIKLLVAIDMLFLLLLALSGSASGILSEIFYYLAFLVPVGIVLNYVYSPDKSSHASGAEAKSAILNDLKRDFTLSKENFAFTLPIIFPAICGIFALSFLTSFLMGLLGYESITEFNEPFLIAVITHALLPAVLEELLFRFAPIKLLSENKKTAFLLSSIMFAFAHANLFQIPYAFLAGAVFSGLYLITGSIIPSVILHFLNNTASLISLYGFGGIVFFIVLFSLSVLSIIYIVLKRDYYKEQTQKVFSSQEKAVLSYHPLVFIGTSLTLATFSLFA